MRLCRLAVSVTALAALGHATPSQAVCSSDANAPFWCLDLNDAFHAPTQNSKFGSALAIGDFNGDGFPDLAISQPRQVDNDRGQVIVVTGTSDLPDGNQRETVNNDKTDFSGLTAAIEFGGSLAALDRNLDGVDDLIIGEPGRDVNVSSGGSCHNFEVCLDSGSIVQINGAAGDFTTLSVQSRVRRDADGCGFSGNGGELFWGSTLATNLAGDLFVGGPGRGLNLDGQAGFVSGRDVDGTCIARYKPATLFGEANNTSRVGASLAAIRKGSGNGATVVFGAPEADNGSLNQLGVVLVQYEVPGNTNPPASAFVQATHWPPAGNGEQDHFGHAVAAGDFDGDGDDDVAVSAPDKDVSGAADAGRIYLLRNDADLIRPISGGILQQSDLNGQTPEAGDRFGATLAAGYINADQYEDLVVGAPGEDVAGGSTPDEGAVYVLLGSPTGLLASNTDFLSFREPGVGGTSVSNANFGSVLAVADFDLDGLDDIVIGIPNRTVDSRNNAGMVYIRRSTGSSGQDARIVANAFSNTPANPVAIGGNASIELSANLFAGPVTHAEQMHLQIELPAHAEFQSNGTLSQWRCSPYTLFGGRHGQRCTNRLPILLGETSETRTFIIKLAPGSSNGAVDWTARADGDATELSPANNSTGATIHFQVPVQLFSNGFE